MKRTLALALPALLFLVSCSKHPLHGGWREEGAKAPRVLEFHAAGAEMMVHTPPRADGGHDHLHGKYSLDGAKLVVEWQEGGTTKSYSGTLAGDRIELQDTASEKLVFTRGAAAH